MEHRRPLMCLYPLHMLHLLHHESFSQLTYRHSPASQPTMQHSSPFLFLAASPLVAAAETFHCNGGVHKTNSTYGANLRRLAAVLRAETAASQGLQASGDVGCWPNRVRASSRCEPPGVNSSSSCASCVATAFREAERACPYGKKVLLVAGNCTLRLGRSFSRSLALDEGGFFDVYSREGNNRWFHLLGPTMLILQAIGFAWLLFMLLQEWLDKRRAYVMHCSSLPSGEP